MDQILRDVAAEYFEALAPEDFFNFHRGIGVELA